VCSTQFILFFYYILKYFFSTGEEESSRKRKLDQVPKIPLMSSVVQSCPLIQELEIMVIEAESRLNESVSTHELSAIAQLIHLKRLTLSKLNVKDGYFIEQVY